MPPMSPNAKNTPYSACSLRRGGDHEGSFSVLDRHLLLLVVQVRHQIVERIGPAVVHELIAGVTGESAQVEDHLGAVAMCGEG